MAPRSLGFGSHRWLAITVFGGASAALLIAQASCAQSSHDEVVLDDAGGYDPKGETGPTPPLGGSSGGGSGGSLGGRDANDDGNVEPDDCPESAGKFVYVVTDKNELYSFDPQMIPTATHPTNNPFKDLGPLHCPGENTPPGDGEGVNSMAVDRHGVAWVNFDDGNIFKVDTTKSNLPCTDSSYDPSQTSFTPQLGMGFATNSASDHTEHLYVSDNGGPGGVGTPGGGKGLGVIDTSTMTLTPTGAWGSPLAGYNAELSGTGDGRLFGFFTTTPSDLAQIDRASAAVSNVVPLTTVNNSQGGYAFSFWGGDFWFYTAFPTPTDPDATTSVTHYVSADGSSSVVMKDVGFTIVGAGSSTCVPTVPPPPPK